MMPTRRRAALAILADVDAGTDGWSCDRSTECCRFTVTGREPWLTPVEWELVQDELKRQGRRPPPVPEADDGRCAFLAADGKRCTIYAARPLGCRTFFCERARGPTELDKRAFRDAARDLAALGSGSRALHSWLGSSRGRAKKPG